MEKRVANVRSFFTPHKYVCDFAVKASLVAESARHVPAGMRTIQLHTKGTTRDCGL